MGPGPQSTYRQLQPCCKVVHLFPLCSIILIFKKQFALGIRKLLNACLQALLPPLLLCVLDDRWFRMPCLRNFIGWQIFNVNWTGALVAFAVDVFCHAPDE